MNNHPFVIALCFAALTANCSPFDAAPFALPLPEGNGLMWKDPRETHRVVVAREPWFRNDCCQLPR